MYLNADAIIDPCPASAAMDFFIEGNLFRFNYDITKPPPSPPQRRSRQSVVEIGCWCIVVSECVIDY